MPQNLICVGKGTRLVLYPLFSTTTQRTVLNTKAYHTCLHNCKIMIPLGTPQMLHQTKARRPRPFLTNTALRFCKAFRQCHVTSLHWRHNEPDGVANHQLHDCLFSCLFRRRSKETWKLRVTGLFEGNSPVTGELPTQRSNNAEELFHLMTLSCQYESYSAISYNANINNGRWSHLGLYGKKEITHILK